MSNHNYFATYIPGSEVIISLLQGTFGPQLEKLDYIEKTIFRAVLTTYVANYPASEDDTFESFIDECIKTAGFSWDVWDNERLVEAIRMCQTLHSNDIEVLIDALSEQIRGKIYA